MDEKKKQMYITCFIVFGANAFASGTGLLIYGYPWQIFSFVFNLVVLIIFTVCFIRDKRKP